MCTSCVSTSVNLSKCKDQHRVQPKGHKGLNFVPRADFVPAEQFPVSHAVCAAYGTGSGCSDPCDISSSGGSCISHFTAEGHGCVLLLMQPPGPAAGRSTQVWGGCQIWWGFKRLPSEGEAHIHQLLVDNHRGERGRWGCCRHPARPCERGAVPVPASLGAAEQPGRLPCIPNRWCCDATES